MSGAHLGVLSGDIRPIFAAIRSLPISGQPGKTPPPQQPQQPPALPFITISRQAGAGGHSLAKCLVDRMNMLDPGEQPWTSWDRELVEKVAADHHISKKLIESMEESNHSWFEEFLAGLSFNGSEQFVSETKVYQRVAVTIRTLAQAGRVAIVGRGGMYLTRNMPGGVHIRLVAPLDYRIDHMAKLSNVSRETAAAQVRQLDRNRETFYGRFWPRETLAPENFTMVLNTASLSDERMVDCIVPLIPAMAAR